MAGYRPHTCPLGGQNPGAGGAAQRRSRHHANHRGPTLRTYVTRLSYVMSLMPPTIVRELNLERLGYKVHPMGPYYQGFFRGRLTDDLRR